MNVKNQLAFFRNKLFGVNAVLYETRNLSNQISRLSAEVDAALKSKQESCTATPESGEFVPPGHFYSCVPSSEDIDRIRRMDRRPKSLPGVYLDLKPQHGLLKKFAEFYKDMPFEDKRKKDYRYFFQNPAYSYSDAIFLHCWLRYLRPKRIIEIGSGYSSCVTLDTNEFFLDNSMKCTFVEPYPDLLKSLIKEKDFQSIDILEVSLQDVDLTIFDSLGANDVLFVDSTHVSKAGSDVNRLIFEVLPRLNAGCFIHIHDIFYPFEYPLEWLEDKRAWNEQYILRAFLQFNSAFKIRLFSGYAIPNLHAWFKENIPDCLKNPGGSIWLEKIN